MVKGYGRDCAALLGLIGGTVDIGGHGPDLFDVLAEETEQAEAGGAAGAAGAAGAGGDSCDGWDRDWRRAVRR
jgi:hypothetical protein